MVGTCEASRALVGCSAVKRAKVEAIDEVVMVGQVAPWPAGAVMRFAALPGNALPRRFVSVALSATIAVASMRGLGSRAPAT